MWNLFFIFIVSVFAHKECEPNGTWYLHPETHKTWSNYTSCIDQADLWVSFVYLFDYLRIFKDFFDFLKIARAPFMSKRRPEIKNMVYKYCFVESSSGTASFSFFFSVTAKDIEKCFMPNLWLATSPEEIRIAKIGIFLRCYIYEIISCQVETFGGFHLVKCSCFKAPNL